MNSLLSVPTSARSEAAQRWASAAAAGRAHETWKVELPGGVERIPSAAKPLSAACRCWAAFHWAAEACKPAHSEAILSTKGNNTGISF